MITRMLVANPSDRRTQGPEGPERGPRVRNPCGFLYPRRWRFWLPLALQVLIVLAVPAPKLAAYAWGTPVVLSVAPVDPYDLLRGRYVQLGYDLDRLALLEGLPGWEGRWAQGEHAVFVTLVPGQAGSAWKAVAIGASRPETLPAGAVALKGRIRDGQPDWGLGQYYMNEAVGDQADAGLRRSPASARAEVRVDGQGNAVLVGVWIEGKRY